jgi:hypothetical protein
MFGLQSTGASQILAGLALHEARAADIGERLEAASDLIYEETKHRFDTEGDGEWPPLAESTVASKESAGYGEPSKPLVAEGNLFESATSPYGPYSQRIRTDNAEAQQIVMLVDWENDGWQIPVVQTEGTDDAGVGHHTRIPARPIWPPAEQMREPVRAILFAGL